MCQACSGGSQKLFFMLIYHQAWLTRASATIHMERNFLGASVLLIFLLDFRRTAAALTDAILLMLYNWDILFCHNILPLRVSCSHATTYPTHLNLQCDRVHEENDFVSGVRGALFKYMIKLQHRTHLMNLTYSHTVFFIRLYKHHLTHYTFLSQP